MNLDDVITINELAKRLRVTKNKAYEFAATPGFPLLNFGGERGKRVIWGDALDWLRKNKGGAA